nr:integrase, catalytic region, zinc finger, CCHC-type, peptidase aspartic, catalytic [Tanacetum cinerariifolium]
MIVLLLKKSDKEENPKVIAPGMFKLSVSHCISPISMSKSSCESNNVEINLKRKRRKRKSSKQNVKQVDNDVSRANSDFIHFSDLDTSNCVRRPKNIGVIWKKKGSSNTFNVALSAISVSKLNKNVKQYSRKDLLACNNSHLGETSSAYVCNDAMNVSCNHRMCNLLDDNSLFIFDDESVKISPVSKMRFRKKPRDSINVRAKSNLNKSLPRTMHKWLPKLQPLAEPIVQICLWIIDSGCSKHMTGNRALLTNFVEKFLETVRFGNNDFAMIVGYGDVVIGSMTIMCVLANKAILSGADNRPPILEKDMYDSWKSIMELYMLNRQHGRVILESVENGPLLWPTRRQLLSPHLLFRNKYRSSYETPSPSSSSSSSSTIPIQKRYRGTSELVEDTEEESSDLNDEREGSEDKGPGLEDEGLGYKALKCRELALEEGSMPSTFETPPSPEWSSGSLPISPSSLVVPSPIASPVTTPVATISVDEDQFLEGYDRDLRELYARSREARDEFFSQHYRLRSLEREQERDIVTFEALWRLVLALEAWARRVDARMAEMSKTRYDDHRLIHDVGTAHRDAA